MTKAKDINKQAEISVLEPFYVRYNKPRKRGIVFKEKTRTKQEFAKDCDINNIMYQYIRSGVVPHYNLGSEQYGDVSEVQTYEESMNFLVKVQSDFDAMPANLRERFANDPKKMLAFLEDDNNRDEAIRLGFYSKPEPLSSPLDASQEPQSATGGDPPVSTK